MKNKTAFFITLLVLYIVSTAVSFTAFSYFSGGKNLKVIETPTPPTNNGFDIDTSGPKTEMCPLNGTMRTENEKEWWQTHRPLGIMVENHEESRPQSGLSKADIIYEAVAEGGITRFLAVYYCQPAKMIGPVRSARTYFIDYISEYADKPLYAHVGGANTDGPADALGQLENYGWVGENDLNQFSIGFPSFWRDYERLPGVATEHTMYTTPEKLWKVAITRGLTNVDGDGVSWDEEFVKWQFKDDAKLADRPESASVDFTFWEGYSAYSVKWAYDKETNTYKRINAGKVHLDKNDSSQLTAKTIVLLFANERNANDGYENNAHLLYTTKGSGKAVFLLDGEKINGTWEKDSRTSRTIFYDSAGQEFTFNKGQIWIEILPTGTDVQYD